MKLSPPFQVCSKCRGEGRLRHRGSKRARLSPNNQNSIATFKPCNPCEGSGLQPRIRGVEESTAATVARSPPQPTVAIIGGGIGGLALGLACWHRDIPFTVFERDKSFLQRQQGYGLTLQQASKALKGFGLADLQGGVTSTRHVVHTPDGSEVGEWGLRKWGRDPSKKAARRQNVHIARQALRRQLLADLPVEWDSQLTGLKEMEDCVELTIRQGDETERTVKADFVVGADGIRSSVRGMLVGELPPLRYLGCIVILGICPLTAIEDADKEDLFDGHTVFQTADGTTRLYSMPFSETEYMWQLSYPLDEDAAKQISQEGKLKESALDKCGVWHNPIPKLLEATPSNLISGYPVYDRPLLTESMLSSSKRITLIGDAAHPMSPFKGQGANQAMLDALCLARALFQDPDTALPVYHEEMLARSAVKVKASADAAEYLHTEVAIQKGDLTRGAAAAAAQSKGV